MIIRPDYISLAQIAEWDKQLDSDIQLQQSVGAEGLKDPILREVLYSGLWIKEKLAALGYDELTLGAVSITHGINSFGANSWQVAELLLEIYSSEQMLSNLNQNNFIVDKQLL